MAFALARVQVGSNCLYSHLVSLATRISELRAQQQGNAHTCPPEIPTLMQRSGVFFGPHSCIADFAQSPGTVPLNSTLDQSAPLALMLQVQNQQLLTAELHVFLLRNYLSTVHPLYPVLDDADPALLPTRWPIHESATTSHRFSVYMIYAISCHAIPNFHRQASTLLPFADRCYANALEYADEATGDVSVQCLRHIALLALYALFTPNKANLAQLVGVAVRLCVDLDIRKDQDKSLCHLFLSVLCVERQIALTFDRPWLLPVPV